MPVSGNEETGVQCLARQSSLDIAGVPIKKRKFIRPLSPLPEEESSQPTVSDHEKKEHGGPTEQPIVSDPEKKENGGPTEDLPSHNASDTKKSFVAEENMERLDNKMEAKGNNCIRVKIEETGHTIQNDSLAKLGNEEKLCAEASSANVSAISAKPELNIALNKAPASTAGEEMNSKQIKEGKGMPVTQAVSRNSELLFGINEHCISTLTDHYASGISQSQKNVPSISLNLSLSQADCNTQSKMEDSPSNNASSNVRAPRSNWDLNTTMDVWESASSDVAADQVMADGLNRDGDIGNIKPSTCSKSVVGTGSNAEKEFHEEGQPRSSLNRVVAEASQQSNTEDSLNLRLSPSFLSLSSNEKPSGSYANKNTSRLIPNTVLPGGVSLGNAKMLSLRTIKSEPYDESHKHDSGKSKANSSVLVRHELVGKLREDPALLGFGLQHKLVPRFIKSEPFFDGSSSLEQTKEEKEKEMSKETGKQVLQYQDTEGQPKSSTEKQLLRGQGNEGEDTCSTGVKALQMKNIAVESAHLTDKLFINDNSLEQTENLMLAEGADLSKVSKDESETGGQFSSEMEHQSMVQCGNELNIPDRIDSVVTENKNVDNFECNLKVTEDQCLDSHGNGEGHVSDEEKVNLSGDIIEEGCYGSEYEEEGCYESDGNSVPMDIEEDNQQQDDYEDGEVQESQVHNAAESTVCEKKEDVGCSGSVNEEENCADLTDNQYHASPHIAEKELRCEGLVETGNDSAQTIGMALDGESMENMNKDAYLEESLTIDMPAGGADENKEINMIQGQTLHVSGRNHDMKSQGTQQASDQTFGGQLPIETVAQGSDGVIIMNNVGMNDSALPKVESAPNCDGTSKDANSGSNRSRIINLPRGSNVLSPGRTRSMSSKPLSSHSGRERLLDVPLEGDKLHPRGRDEIYEDSTRKFSRDRHQDHSYSKSRFNFGRGRGRYSSRIDMLRGDRNPERGFIPDFYNGPYGIPRNKYVFAEAGADFANCNVGPDGTFVGPVRGGRKIMDDEAPVFRRQPSRRRSPGGRDGPAARGLQIVRRAQRSMGDEGDEGVGLRHADKFMRGYPDDGAQHTFARPQPSYDELNDQFVQGTRNFSSAQRRGLPQIRSKSPIRSHSPGPWSSSKRSPDAFGGPPELPHRRTPPVYRMERIRSPEHPVFPGEMLVRRHGSPSYLPRANDLRDMEHGHPRSIISNRSPTGQVLLRNTRRGGIVDPRERTDGDEFFGGPMHSRFNELGDGNGEERRRFGERRGLRSLRPSFNGPDSENFHLNAEDGPRPIRFFQEDNSQFHERGMREREFDRRIKNRPANAPRRPRGIEEQEGNYRHGGQVLYDDAFDMSQGKRKRF